MKRRLDAVAGTLDCYRTMILAELRKRKTEVRWRSDGRPYQADIVRMTGLSPATVSRVMRSRMHQRPGVLRPRRDEYEPSPELVKGLAAWLNMDEDDLRAYAKTFSPTSPFPTQGDRG